MHASVQRIDFLVQCTLNEWRAESDALIRTGCARKKQNTYSFSLDAVRDTENRRLQFRECAAVAVADAAAAVAAAGAAAAVVDSIAASIARKRNIYI